MTNPYTSGAVVYESQLPGEIGIQGIQGETGEVGAQGPAGADGAAATVVGDFPVGGTWTAATIPAITQITFDPANKNAHAVLTNGDLTATGDAPAAHAAVLGTISKSAGKYYNEFVLSGTTGNVGIGTSSTTLVDGKYLGFDSNAYGLNKTTSNIYNNAAPIVYGDGVGIANGAVISMLYDADADTLAFWKNGVLIAAAIAITPGDYFPAASVYDVATITANFGDTAYAYAAPVGYEDWQDAPTIVPLVLPSHSLGGDLDLNGHNIIGLPIFAEEVPVGVVNDANTVFTLSAAPSPTSSLSLYVNGILYKAGGVHYTIVGLTVTFVAAATPQVGDKLYATFRY